MSAPVRLPITPARREAALRFLFDRIDYERWLSVPYRDRELKLDRMRELLARLGNPQATLPIIHVAGTKGKGSTAVMIGAMLSAAGYRTGVFTSPHLERLEERMAVGGQACSPDDLVELVDRIAPVVRLMDEEAARLGDTGPTYFEITTAMALIHFVDCRVNAAVLEVGLGGRLDSTNVCLPEVCAITSISFDHMKQLGNTLAAIAREKAGIIKPGVPVVSGVTDLEPRDVIRQVCREQGSRLVELDRDFDFVYHPPRGLERAAAPARMDFRCRASGRERVYSGLGLQLPGRHQAANAAVALAVAEELRGCGWEIPEEAIRRGLLELDWPARIEVISRSPVVIVDAAHNRASIDALVQVLDESFSARRRLLVFATTQEKDLRGMLGRLAGCFDHVILTRYLNNPRGVPPEELAEVALELTGHRYRICGDPAQAWSEILALAAPDDLICVTGSFFIAAEMRHEIRTRPLSF